MTRPAWEDCTTYSRDDRERIPTAFEIRSGDIRIAVTNGHIHYRGVWIMHCFAIGMDTQPIPGATSREDAQARAVNMVRNRLNDLLTDLEEIR